MGRQRTLLYRATHYLSARARKPSITLSNMTNDAQPGEPDATAILQTCYEALEQRNQRIEELQLSLDRKQEEQDMLAGNLRLMEEQLKQLHVIVQQRISGSAPPTPTQNPTAVATEPVAATHAAAAPTAIPNNEENDGEVFTWPDGSLHSIPPPPQLQASKAARTTAKASARSNDSETAKSMASLMPESLRQPLRALEEGLTRVPAQLSRELDEALQRGPAAHVGKQLAEFSKSGSMLFGKLTASARKANE